MTLEIIERTLTDDAGNLLEGATVTVRDGHAPGGDLAELFSDADGETALANPLTVASGTLSVYAQPGRYRLEGTSGAGAGVALVSALPVSGKNYDTRAEAVADIAAGYTAPNGTVFTAAGLSYMFDNAAGNPIADMPGVVPTGEITSAHFGDDAAAVGAAVNYAGSSGVGKLVIQNQDITFTGSQIDLPTSITEIEGRNAILRVGTEKTDAIFRLSGEGQTGPSTSLTSAVTENDITIQVADASSFAPGDVIRINSNEYFSGITGRSGYGAQAKAQFNEVMSISGNTITLKEPMAFSFSLSGVATVGGEAVSTAVQKSVLKENFEFHGFNCYGPGGTAETSSPPGLGGVLEVRHCRSLCIHDLDCYNFSDDILFAGYSIGVEVYNCGFRGPDLKDATNLPLRTVRWTKGLQMLSCEDINFHDNYCEGLRRPMDPSTASGGNVISRKIKQHDCIVKECGNMIGGHMCYDYQASGNIGSADVAIGFRGVNGHFSDNTCHVMSFRAVSLGVGGAQDTYPEYNTSGHVLLADNYFYGDLDYGIINAGDIDSLEERGNVFEGVKIAGALIYGKRLKDITLEGTYGGVDGTPNASSAAVIIPNQTNNPLEELDGLRVNIKTTKGFNRGVEFPGTNSGVGAKNVYIAGTFERLTSTPVVLTYITSSLAENFGNFAEPPVIGPLKVVSGASVITVQEPAQGGFMPVYEGLHVDGSENAAILVTRRNSETSSLVAFRNTVLAGQRVYHCDPTVSGYMGKVVLESGTQGSLATITGTISSGSDEVTISDADLLHVGAYIKVAGAGAGGDDLDTRVIEKHGSVLTLANTASTSVTDAAVTSRQPVVELFGPIGEVVHISNSDGECVRYPDGTQICWNDSLELDYVNTSTLRNDWTFPAPFADDDRVVTVCARRLAGVTPPSIYRQGIFLDDEIGVTQSSTARLALLSNSAFTDEGSMAVRVKADGRWR